MHRIKSRKTSLAIAVFLAAGGSMGSSHANADTLGFVVTSTDSAIYKTKFWDECPDGAAIGPAEYWWLSRSREKRKALGGMPDVVTMFDKTIYQRGPHGEDICWKPTLFKDPAQSLAGGPTAWGVNLDGTVDGQATATTCAHEKFANSPDGEKNVDNQLYRVIGCIPGYRDASILDGYASHERKASGRGLTLMEITGVDDQRNDDEVQVHFYRAIGQLPQGPDGNILPFASYKVDADVKNRARYGAIARGKITDGVLTTAPADVDLPSYGQNGFFVMGLRGMRIKITIAEDGKTAKGIVAGYYDLERWYHYLTNIQYLTALATLNCPSVYEAAMRLADGYPDPKTGKCTAISSAFNFEMTAAFVVHPKIAHAESAPAP